MSKLVLFFVRTCTFFVRLVLFFVQTCTFFCQTCTFFDLFVLFLTTTVIEFEYEYLNKKILAFITKQSKDYNLPYVHWTRKQYPISLAYWLTMHKCQGQTIDGVVILWDDIFWSGLFYSILSRCRNANNIHIKNLDIKKAYISRTRSHKPYSTKRYWIWSEFLFQFRNLSRYWRVSRNLSKNDQRL